MDKLTARLRARLAAAAACLWDSIRSAWALRITKINALATLMLVYLMQDPDLIQRFYSLFLPQLQPFLKLIMPLLWWQWVQNATKRAVEHGK